LSKFKQRIKATQTRRRRDVAPENKLWRVMDAEGFGVISGKKDIFKKGEDAKIKTEIKESIKNKTVEKVLNKYNLYIKGNSSNALISDEGFMSTSLGTGVLYGFDLPRKSIILCIKTSSNVSGLLIDEYTPTKYQSMSEFLLPCKTALKFENVSTYTGENLGSSKVDGLENFLQVNCRV